MIAYLKGKVIDVFDGGVILENNGIGYEVFCSSSAINRLTLGTTGEIYTYMQVREDGISLFGFETKEEKRMFLKLISVSGVGPKMGIGVLSGMSLADLATAIATSDVKTLSKVKGLGKKTAERIILELREGVSGEEFSSLGEEKASVQLSSDEEDAVIALMGLGFNGAMSRKAVSSAKEGGAKTIEEVISYALRSIGR